MQLQTPALAGEVHQLLQEPLLLHSTAETQSKPIQKKRIVNDAPIVQEALTSVNKQLASELAISQTKCVQQKSELALKDTQLEAMKQKLTEFKPHNIRRCLQRKLNKKIAEQKENIRRLEKEVKASHRASTKRIQSRVNYYQKNCMDLQEYEEEETCKHCSELEKENSELKQQLLDLKQANAQLLDEVKQGK